MTAPSGGEIAAYLALFTRAVSLFQSAPLLGDKMLSPRIRVAAAGLAALALSTTRPPIELGALPRVIPSEILFGLLAGFAARLVLSGAEAGGQLIGLELELGFAATFDARLAEEALPTRRIVSSLVGLAFLGAGGLEAAVAVLARAPVSSQLLEGTLPQLVDASGQVLVAGLRLAAPALVACVVANLSVALASRAAPALNVFSVMLALVLLIGATTLLSTAPAFVREVLRSGELAARAFFTL